MSFMAQVFNWFNHLDTPVKFLVIIALIIILFLVIGIIGGIADILDIDDRYYNDR